MEIAFLQNKEGKYYSATPVKNDVVLNEIEIPLIEVPKEIALRKEDEKNYRSYNDFPQKRFRFSNDGAFILRYLFLLGYGIESDCTLRIEGESQVVGNLDFTTIVVRGTGHVEINCVLY